MTYRDDLETRRARVRHLEEEVRSLEREESLVRALPAQWGRFDRLFGPGVLTREVTLPLMPDDEVLAAVARESFDIDGRLSMEGEVHLWQGTIPGVVQRRVEIRVERTATGSRLRMRDTQSRLWYGLLPSILYLYTSVWRTVFGLTVMLALFAVAFYAVRTMNVRAGRRRARQTMAFKEALLAKIESSHANVRVDTDEAFDVDDDVAHERKARAR